MINQKFIEIGGTVRLFKKLRRKMGYLSEKQIEGIYHAYLTAAMAHEGQKRFTGEPYITHPVAVACILADIQMDKQSIMAALLHDVIEDTKIDKKTLAAEFGEQVAELVDGVSKLTQIEFKSRAEAQAENFRKMVLAMARDIRVIIVKLADRLHNMRTLEPLRPAKRRRIAQETLDIFAPIANRLGMHSFYVELEELGFAALYPKRYEILKEAVRKARGNRKEILGVIFELLKSEIAKHQLPYCEVIGREKHLYSIYKKMRNKQLSFNEIMDVYAFRIIVDTVDNCYRILGIVHSLYKPFTERFKDYIAIPKANCYQSLHTTLFGPYGVPIEIQIRTQEMDEMANYGIAAHWLYKTGEKLSNKPQVRAQKWVKNLLEMQQSAGNSLEFIENVKVDLFPEEVYVFTPHGDIMELPVCATPVDYAYAVHTDIGNTCVAAKIDRQLAPLSTVLSNGQTVEIITSVNARPNPAWLDFVVTGKARSGIRHFLKVQHRTESISLGKQLINKALANLSLSLKKIPEETLNVFLSQIHLASMDDLFEELGLGNRVPLLVAHRLASAMDYPSSAVNVEDMKFSKPLIIKGTEGMVMHFATCCYPIPGDPIVGLFQAGQGIIVHTEQCKRITKIRRHPEKCMLVRWSPELVGEFPVIIEVEVLNKRGVLAMLAMAISDAEANIDDIRISECDGQHHLITFKLIVQNRSHLARVIRLLRNVKSIVHIRRGKTH
jgi:GTP diphosphokinase / guanosine-3',5'-bis(diphosphate) 3'-diphosphatase